MSDTNMNNGITKVYASQEWVKENTIPSPVEAEVGQAIIVKAVDENGKPTEWECTDLGGQADWSQNDETSDDYVKNRTHWAEVVENAEIIPETTASPSVFDAGEIFTNYNLMVGYTYKVTLNGTEYECVAYELAEIGLTVIGNAELFGISGSSNEPFGACVVDGSFCMTFTEESGLWDATEVTVKCVGYSINYHKLPNEYAPEYMPTILLEDYQNYSRKPLKMIYIEDKTNDADFTARTHPLIFYHNSLCVESDIILSGISYPVNFPYADQTSFSLPATRLDVQTTSSRKLVIFDYSWNNYKITGQLSFFPGYKLSTGVFVAAGACCSTDGTLYSAILTQTADDTTVTFRKIG